MRKFLLASVSLSVLSIPVLRVTGCQPEIRTLPPVTGQQSKRNIKVLIKENPNIPDSAKSKIQ